MKKPAQAMLPEPMLSLNDFGGYHTPLFHGLFRFDFEVTQCRSILVLKGANALIRHRNVLTRAERLEKLKEEEKWTDAKSVFGLPKVGHSKATVAKAAKEEAAEEQ